MNGSDALIYHDIIERRKRGNGLSRGGKHGGRVAVVLCHGDSSLVVAKVVMIPGFTTGSTRNRRRTESELKFQE